MQHVQSRYAGPVVQPAASSKGCLQSELVHEWGLFSAVNWQSQAAAQPLLPLLSLSPESSAEDVGGAVSPLHGAL